MIAWLPWDDGSHESHERLAYTWAKRFETLLMEFSPTGAVLHLDHTAGLADTYLRARPQALEAVKAAVLSGSLWPGPWYASPAPLLASGETLVRNLLLGVATARALGTRPTVCILLPCPLYSEQLPQILRGFGVMAAATIVPRTKATCSRQTWRGSDGSEIALVYLSEMAANTEASSWVYAGTSSATGDSLGIAPVTDARDTPGLAASSLNDELALAPGGPLLTGELLLDNDQDPSDAPHSDATSVTADYISTWPSLRLATWHAQLLLERWAEPWATAAWLHGADYPQPYLEKAWIHLLENQRRDATGGCVGEGIYRHMLVRAERSRQLAELITHDCLNAVASANPSDPLQTSDPKNSSTPLWVVNPLGWRRSEIVTAQVDMPAHVRYLELRSDLGQALPYQLHRMEPASGAARADNCRRFTLSFKADALPALGFRRLEVVPSATRPYFMGESLAAGNTLENRFLRVTVKANGALRIEDKRTGAIYDNCNVFEDGGDAGTIRMFSPPEQDRIITTYAAHAQISIVENGLDVGTIQVQHELDLQAELRPFRNPRQDRHPLEITSYVTLRRDTPRVEIRTCIINRDGDHRLRVLFSSGIPAGTCWVAQPFAVTARQPGAKKRGPTGGPERETMPKAEFVGISASDHGLLVATRGLHEYEIKPTPAGTIAITLLRALETNDSPMQSTHQSLEFNYALIPHEGTWHQAFRSAWEFCAVPRTFTFGNSSDAPQRSLFEAPARFSIAALEPAPLMISAVKRSEDGRAAIVRGYNPTGKQIIGELSTDWPIATAHLAALDETPLQALECTTPHLLSVPFAPYEIVTLRLRRASRTH